MKARGQERIARTHCAHTNGTAERGGSTGSLLDCRPTKWPAACAQDPTLPFMTVSQHLCCRLASLDRWGHRLETVR